MSSVVCSEAVTYQCDSEYIISEMILATSKWANFSQNTQSYSFRINTLRCSLLFLKGAHTSSDTVHLIKENIMDFRFKTVFK